MEEGGGKDLKERTLRSIKQGLGRLWRRRSVTITEYDPSYKVSYLGNVLTGWAKGEGCVEKPLCTLWKNYQTTSKPEVHMKVTVTQSGLKAVTKEHGLTEYWSHRITYCAAPSAFPKVFCWVYRHEGRKLKQELRCHAVLCSKEATARRMAQELRSRLAQALTEFKRDKLSKQNARLSLANSVYDNPSLPRRKILLSTGSQNYRPPLERSKSAPKLMSIEESLEEEDEPEIRKSFRTKERFRILGKSEEKEEESKDLFTGDVWGKDGVHVVGDFDYPEGGDRNDDKDEQVELDPRPKEGDSENRNRREAARMSWGGEDVRLFVDTEEEESYRRRGEDAEEEEEGSLGARRVIFDDDEESGVFENRKKLVASLLAESEIGFTKLYQRDHLDYVEEESTPSLQSISSGSDRGECGGCRAGVGQPGTLADSLSEEESDESGFAESLEGSQPPHHLHHHHHLRHHQDILRSTPLPPGGGPPDDKVRDLPHHQLVKQCILTTNSHCVQV